MSDLDVALRLRLQQNLSREGPRARKELEGIRRAAHGLNGANAQRLKSDLRETASTARRTRAGLDDTRRSARQLDQQRLARLRGELRQTQGDVRRLKERFDELGRTRGAMRETGAAAGLMAGAATRAWGALAAFMSVDAVVRGMGRIADGYREIDRAAAQAATTAEMRDPKAVEQIMRSDAVLNERYGLTRRVVADTRNTFAAGGFSLADQDKVLDPTLKTAKAKGADPNNVAQAAMAFIENMGLRPEQLPQAYDAMAKGMNLGRFEVDAMSRYFPQLGAQYAALGGDGLKGITELIALAQVVRKGSGTQEEAATNFQNILTKITSPDTIKNFQEQGVDLEAVVKEARKNGTHPLLAVVDKAMEMTGGDEFRIGELFGDMQAKNALRPLIQFRELLTQWMGEIEKESAGTVDEDWNFNKDRPAEVEDRERAKRENAQARLGAATNDATALVSRIYTWVWEDIARSAESFRQRGLNPLIPNPLDSFQRFREALGGGASEPEPQRSTAERARAFRERNGLPPVDRNLRPQLEGAARESMDGFNEALEAEGQKALGIAESIAARIKAIFSFTVTPTIAPTFGGAAPAAPSAPAPSGAPGKQSSLLKPTSGSKFALTQNIYGTGDSRAIARRVLREQDRAVRRVQAAALHDTGRLA